LRILFYGGDIRGWGFAQDFYDYVMKDMEAKQIHSKGQEVDLEYLQETFLRDYDLIWCEGETAHVAVLWRYLLRTKTLHKLRLRSIFAKSTDAKIISRFHYHDPESYLKDFTWKGVQALCLSDVIACVSEYWKSIIKKHLFFVPNFEIVHNGVDCQKYHPNKAIREDKTIFYLAITYPRKRLHLLIQALKHLPQWTLIVGGPSKAYNPEVMEKVNYEGIPVRGAANYWQWCHQLAEQYKDRVVWTGFLPLGEKIKMYQRTTVFCLPSVMENWGVVTLEAMACGTPAVCCRVGGIPEFVPDNQLVNVNATPRELAEKIKWVAENDKKLGLSELNRQVALKFDWSQIKREVEHVFSKFNIG